MGSDHRGIPPDTSDIETALHDREAAVRDRILVDIAGFENPDRQLVRVAICDPDPAIRVGAVVAVARTMAPPAVVPLLIEICDDPEGENRGRSAWALGKLGSDAGDALTTLINQAERDDSLDARYGAMWAVARLGPDATAAEARVRGCLQTDEDSSFRAIAATALGAIGATSTETRRVLGEALLQEETLVREEAAAALGRIGTDPDGFEALLEALRDRAPLIREAAAMALGRVGSDSEAAVVALTESLSDPAGCVRHKAGDALTLIGRRPPIDRLRVTGDEVPDASDEDLRAIEHWTKQLDADDPFIRAEAAWELYILGPLARPALARLRRQAAEDGDSDARWAACLAIGRSRYPDPENLRTLQESATGDWDPDVRSAAVEALGGLGFESSELVGPISRALLDEDSLVREEACSALERIGRITPDALIALRRTVHDSHPSVCGKARSAISVVERFASL